MKCSNCGFTNVVGSKFCNECGLKLELKCSGCGKINQSGSKYCNECGSSLFWHPRDRKHIAVAAGSLDEPIHLEVIGHVWTSQISGYFKILDDLPQFQKGWEY